MWPSNQNAHFNKILFFFGSNSFLSTSHWDQNLIVMQHQIVQLEAIGLFFMKFALVFFTNALHFFFRFLDES